ncbi:DNA repair and recombination protein RAD54B-like isoform X1 [Osmia bicornis bicornis]|uniref:DNA repair and recombination protein RAD54B-like isoform X1 n=1 Tax=Osmia bicornis bicornis TaxID=1437191 RepID=UPI0010F89521|nr:DNA repair and recombination protein RAD54B-like isoform X1 [Osmia bicornis bicornis]
MYRNSRIRDFKSILKHQQSTGTKSKENVENDNKLPENTGQTSVRSTSKILNLLKKPEKSCTTIQKENDVINTNKDKDNVANVENSATPAEKMVFNVVIGKQSTRKHKKWEDDGILEVKGKHAILKDTEDNVIHTSVVNPKILVEGFRMYMGNKEIEIVDKVLCTKSILNEVPKETIPEPPKKKFKSTNSGPYIPFNLLQQGLKLIYDPLVMPAIYASKSWMEDETPENEIEVSVDACLVNVLRPHQRHGIIFLYECIMGLKTCNYYGAILADEMGLGKTLQCITLIWTLLKKGPYGKPILKNVLIVTPSSLCNNWNKEFKHWLGFHRLCPYVVNAKNKPKDFKKQARNSVIIISYDMLIRCEEELEQINFDLIVCDEGHRLKNNDIKAAKILNNINCKRRILLTGTPIQNDLQEFFALVNFVNPSILGSNYDFKNYYENPIVASRCPHAPDSVVSLGTERASELHEKTKCFILRRTQEIINKYLPSKHELIVFCRLSKEQEKLYSLVTDTWFNKSILPNNNIPHLTVITTLKKICNHPKLFYNDKNEFLHNDLKNLSRTPNINNYTNMSKTEYCGKISLVHTLMKNLKNTDEKLVLISYFTQTLDILETVCNTEGLHFLRLDGSTPVTTRSKIIERFNSKNDNNKIFLLSAKAGGVGLNLFGASRLILFDSDWNPASDSQAMARIWRDGQKKDVYILRLLTAGTIEEKIFQRQISKAGLSETVVDSNSFASLKLSMTELKDLFTLTTDTNCLTHDLMECSCNGCNKVEKAPQMLHQDNEREYQFFLNSKAPLPNLTINQLSKWEHYQQPVPNKILQVRTIYH